MDNRDYRIEVLRTIAILLVIIAHVSPPTFILDLRSFDTPLLTILMSMSFVITYNPNTKYVNYITKRFKRLIVSTWIFLTIFFLFFSLVNIFSETSFNFDVETIVKSYTLLSGIGYVWIIRIFFTVAIINPFLIKLYFKLSKLLYKLTFLSFVLIIQQVLVMYTKDMSGIKYILLNLIVANSFGYAIIAFVGITIYKQNKKDNLVLAFYFTVIFITCFMIYGSTVSLHKHPASPYYICYGALISVILWFIVSKYKITNIEQMSSFKWISTNSLNIYYWHIIPVFFIDNYTSGINWIIMYCLVLVFAIHVTMIQNKIFPNIFNPTLKKPKR